MQNITGEQPVANQFSRTSAENLLELLTVHEIAVALRVPSSWVYERTRRRGRERMPHLKLGKYLRFRLHEVRNWIEQGAAQ